MFDVQCDYDLLDGLLCDARSLTILSFEKHLGAPATKQECDPGRKFAREDVAFQIRNTTEKRLLCLLHASVGVLLRKNKDELEAFERCHELTEIPAEDQERLAKEPSESELQSGEKPEETLRRLLNTEAERLRACVIGQVERLTAEINNRVRELARLHKANHKAEAKADKLFPHTSWGKGPVTGVPTVPGPGEAFHVFHPKDEEPPRLTPMQELDRLISSVKPAEPE
jgi:hypothetical protein